jgi:hypothetical protein
MATAALISVQEYLASAWRPWQAATEYGSVAAVALEGLAFSRRPRGQASDFNQSFSRTRSDADFRGRAA